MTNLFSVLNVESTLASFIASTFSLYDFFKMKIEISAVNSSAIGKVHQTIFVTFSDSVNKYAIGNTKITNLNNDIINGLNAYPKDCNTPCTATENPMNIYPILAILSAVVHIIIISVVVPPVSPNKLARGLANISKIAVRINVTIAVSIIPYFNYIKLSRRSQSAQSSFLKNIPSDAASRPGQRRKKFRTNGYCSFIVLTRAGGFTILVSRS